MLKLIDFIKEYDDTRGADDPVIIPRLDLRYLFYKTFVFS